MAAVAVVEAAAGKDAIAEGLVDLLKPAIKQLDTHVHAVRYFLSPPESMCHSDDWNVRPSDYLLTSQNTSSGVIVICLLLEHKAALNPTQVVISTSIHCVLSTCVLL